MRSLCIFCHYSPKRTKIPYYVRVYTDHLKKFFDDLIIVTNTKAEGVFQVPNIGYDFGMYSQVFDKHEIVGYNKVALVNDSVVLFNTLDSIMEWADKSRGEFLGLTDSKERGLYHFQSYFWIFRGRAVGLVADYFKKKNMTQLIRKSRNKKEFAINQCEIGISQYLFRRNVPHESFFNMRNMPRPASTNLTIFQWRRLLNNNFPMIKKTIVKSKAAWRDIVREKTNPDWSFSDLFGFVPHL